MSCWFRKYIICYTKVDFLILRTNERTNGRTDRRTNLTIIMTNSVDLVQKITQYQLNTKLWGGDFLGLNHPPPVSFSGSEWVSQVYLSLQTHLTHRHRIIMQFSEQRWMKRTLYSENCTTTSFTLFKWQTVKKSLCKT